MPADSGVSGGGGNSTTNINIDYIWPQFNGTSVTFLLVANNSNLINSYTYKIDRGSVNFVPLTTESNGLFTVNNFAPGGVYTIQARSYIGTNATGQYGNLVQFTFIMPSTVKAAAIASTLNSTSVLEGGNFTNANSVSNATENNSNDTSGPAFAKTGTSIPISAVQTQQSLFKLSQLKNTAGTYAVAYKSFTQLDIAKQYYSFGTTMFFESTASKPSQSGGFAFFISNDGMDGYVLKIETTRSSAVNSNQREFKILRIKGGMISELQDSQVGSGNVLKGIYGGQSYKIDVKVACDQNVRIITAYVNGFKITATDSDVAKMLPITNNVAMICNFGTAYFDYVYGMHLDLESYNKEYLFNVYEGKYPTNIISFLYGEKVSLNDPGVTPATGGFIEEFGAVARELRVLKTKYESRPAFPLYASVGINKFVKIIGQRLTSSGAEVYILNNAGTYIPLDDSEYYSFYMLGKYVSQSGQLEYTDNTAGEYTSQEPVIFESSWIQKNSDVVSLGNWIKNVWSKKQMVVTMSVFGNPLLSVGDIIKIKYEYNGLTTDQKFLITDINNSYNQGLETSITCRTL